MTPSVTDECIDLIREANLPLPARCRPAFYERVSALLTADEILVPSRVLAACQTAQSEFLIGGPIDVDEPRPAPRSPYQRRTR